MDEETLPPAVERCLGLNPVGNYFDVFSYVADQHNIEVELTIDCPCLGLLDKDAVSNGVFDLKKGQKATVSMAAASALRREGLVTPRMPQLFGPNGVLQSVEGNFSREACCLVNLESISPAFFEFGFAVAYLLESDDLDKRLGAVLQERMKAAATIISFESDAIRSKGAVEQTLLTTSIERYNQAVKLHGLKLPADDSLVDSHSLNHGALLEQQYASEAAKQCMDAREIAAFTAGQTLAEKRAFEMRRKVMTAT